MRFTQRIIYLFSLLAIAVCPLMAQEPLGIFEDHQDVGDPNIPGLATFSAGKYEVDAVGANIGYRTTNDQFHFVFKKMSGDFAIQATPFPLDLGWGGVMVRQTLDGDSVQASLLMTTGAAVRGTGALDSSVFPTYRSLKGGATKTDGDPEPGGLTDNHTGPIRLEKNGNTFRYYTFNSAGAKVLIRTEVVPMSDPVYVGLAATAMQADGLGMWEFTDVSIEEYPLTVVRKLPTDQLQKGANLSPVTLTANARSGQVSNATVTEVFPVGSKPSNIKVTAGEFLTNPNGSVSWILTGLSGQATMTYDLKLGSFGSWQGTFTDGTIGASYIGGDAVLPKAPVFEARTAPYPVDKNFITLIQAESGEVWQEGSWGLVVDPRTRSGITAMSVNSTASNVLTYNINVAEAGTYYLFGSVRGEDGNSDSFHFAVDALPAGDDSSRWNINSAKAFQTRWVSSVNPNLNPRPFDLTAGEHTLFIGNREDDASIDWLAITSNGSFAYASFQELDQFAGASRVLPAMENKVTGPVNVKINLAVKSGSTPNVVIEETPPAGWTITNLTGSMGTAVMQDGKIVWTIPAAKNSTLSYTAAPKEGDIVGVFAGTLTDQTNEYSIAVGGNQYVPTTLNFQLAAKPFDIGMDTVFLQAEMPNAFSGSLAIKPDPTLVTQLCVESLSSGQANSLLTDQELTFKLNVLQTGTYYIFAKCRGEDSNSDSFFVGFDVTFLGMAPDDKFGYQISGNGQFERRWYQTYTEGGRFWDVTGEPRPFDLTAGAHTLSWHSRETSSKVDWIAITTDPTLDIDAILEPGEIVAVQDYMLY